MSQPTQPNQTLLTPEYWGGRDIRDEVMFTSASLSPAPLHLDAREFEFARRCLTEDLGRLTVGETDEISYFEEFDPDVIEGTIVIIDKEELARWTYDDPSHRQAGDSRADEHSTIERPFVQHWLSHQDGSEDMKHRAGVERVRFPNEFARYLRLLSWGVVCKDQERRKVVQPFGFSTTRLLPGDVVVTPGYSSEVPRPEAVMQLPVRLGETEVRRRLEIRKHGYAIDTLERTRSIDVVRALN